MAARYRLQMLAALCVLACDSSTGPEPALRIQRMSENHGNAQVDTVLARLEPFRVLVTRGDRPASGIAVSWGTDDSTIVGTTRTDDSGIASLRFALGMQPGDYALTAKAAGATGPGVTFTATATPASPTTLAYISGYDQFDSTLAVLTADYVVRVTDSYGNPIGGVAVDWSVAEGAGSIAPARSTTVPWSGEAAARHTLGPEDGEHEVTATAVGIAAAQAVTFSSRAYEMGSLDVMVTTSGTDFDATGYELRIGGPEFNSVVSVTSSQSISLRLRPNDYTVALQDAAVNCDLAGAFTRPVAVTRGGVGTTSFAIECGEAARLAYASPSNGGGNAIWTAKANGAEASRLTVQSSSADQPAWSPDGSRIAFRSYRDGNAEIYVMNSDGSNVLRLTNNDLPDEEPSWSPDGTRIVFVSERQETSARDIYVMNADGSGLQRLTSGTSCPASPAWSPDGGRIAYTDGCNDASEIFLMNADGSNVVRLTDNTIMDDQPAWSPDGTRLAFSRGYAMNTCADYLCQRDVWVMDADGTDALQLTAEDDADDFGVAWSPDGRWIAFASTQCDNGYYGCWYPTGPVVFAVSVDGARRARITPGEGSDPAWRP